MDLGYFAWIWAIQFGFGPQRRQSPEDGAVGCFKSIFFSTDSVACLSEYVTGDKIHWCGGNFGIAFAVLVHGQKIGSSQHSRKKYFSKIPKKVSL